MLTANLEVVRVMAGRTKYFASLRVKWQSDSRLGLGLAHLAEDLLRGRDQVHPPLLLSRSTERHTFWMRGHEVTAETHIVEIISHVEFDK